MTRHSDRYSRTQLQNVQLSYYECVCSYTHNTRSQLNVCIIINITPIIIYSLLTFVYISNYTYVNARALFYYLYTSLTLASYTFVIQAASTMHCTFTNNYTYLKLHATLINEVFTTVAGNIIWQRRYTYQLPTMVLCI